MSDQHQHAPEHIQNPERSASCPNVRLLPDHFPNGPLTCFLCQPTEPLPPLPSTWGTPTDVAAPGECGNPDPHPPHPYESGRKRCAGVPGEAAQRLAEHEAREARKDRRTRITGMVEVLAYYAALGWFLYLPGYAAGLVEAGKTTAPLWANGLAFVALFVLVWFAPRGARR